MLMTAGQAFGKHRSTVQSREHIRKGKTPSQYYRYTYPWISLSSRWLETAGFREGDSIRIKSYPGKLIIIRESGDRKDTAS